MHITMDHAEAAIRGARAEAEARGTRMCIAIVDSGANLKAFSRMDDAWVGSMNMACSSARSASAARPSRTTKPWRRRASRYSEWRNYPSIPGELDGPFFPLIRQRLSAASESNECLRSRKGGLAEATRRMPPQWAFKVVSV